MSTTADFYELLEVTRDADDGALKSAYRKQAIRFHPDKNPGCHESEAKFKSISQAYECLKDPQKRAAYDRFGHEAYQNDNMGAAGQGGGAGFSDIGDIFESIFGNGFAGAGGGRQQGRRGADLRFDMEISLDEAYHGKQAEIEIEVAQTCEPCSGTGATPGTSKKRCSTCAGHGKVRTQQGFFMMERTCPTCMGHGQVIEKPCRACGGEGRIDKPQKLEVAIPRGVDTGTRIRLTGRGEAGPNGAPPGDLYIFLHIRQHSVFERDGTTLVVSAPITFATAALGGEITIPGLDGQPHLVAIPAGIQSGKQLRKRGAGMPVLNGRGVGDLVVEVIVNTPTDLSPRQKELLREFQALAGEESQQSKGFFERFKKA